MSKPISNAELKRAKAALNHIGWQLPEKQTTETREAMHTLQLFIHRVTRVQQELKLN